MFDCWEAGMWMGVVGLSCATSDVDVGYKGGMEVNGGG